MTITARRFPLFFAAAALLGGCGVTIRTNTVRTKPALALPAPAERIPVKAGIHYPPELAKYWHGRSYMTGRTLAPVGEDSVAMLDELLPPLFMASERLPAFTPGEGAAPAVDVVLEPSIEHFDFFIGEEKAAPSHAVAYRMSLFTPRGELISTWTVEGRVEFVPGRIGPLPEPDPLDPANTVDSRARLDGATHATENLADAGRKLAAGFRSASRIDDYVASRDAGRPLALEGLEIAASVASLRVEIPGAVPSLLDHGIVPVRVRIANRGAAPVRIAGVVARLALADGRTLQSAGASGALSRLELVSSFSAAQMIAVSPIGGAIAGMARESAKSDAMATARAKLGALALRPGTIAPGEAIEGHLLFVPQSGIPPWNLAATLSVWVVDDDLRSAHGIVALQVPQPSGAVRTRASVSSSGPN